MESDAKLADVYRLILERNADDSGDAIDKRHRLRGKTGFFGDNKERKAAHHYSKASVSMS